VTLVYEKQDITRPGLGYTLNPNRADLHVAEKNYPPSVRYAMCILTVDAYDGVGFGEDGAAVAAAPPSSVV